MTNEVIQVREIVRPGVAASCFSLLLLATALVCGAAIGGIALYALMNDGSALESGPCVAVIDIVGEIMDTRTVLADLADATDDPDTKAIVLRIDSPGGDITVCEEIFRELRREGDKGLPIVASMGSTCASGGYYLALAANEIYANETSLTGSIGVLMDFMSAPELLQKLGVRYETIRSGEFKAAGGMAEVMTEAQRAQFQEIINECHRHFVTLVAARRSMTPEQASSLADGREFLGLRAKELGLIDRIGGEQDAIDRAAQLGGIAGEPRVRWIEPVEDFTLLDWLGGQMSGRGVKRHTGPVYFSR